MAILGWNMLNLTHAALLTMKKGYAAVWADVNGFFGKPNIHPFADHYFSSQAGSAS
jgi:hypothetical protein